MHKPKKAFIIIRYPQNTSLTCAAQRRVTFWIMCRPVTASVWIEEFERSHCLTSTSAYDELSSASTGPHLSTYCCMQICINPLSHKAMNILFALLRKIKKKKDSSSLFRIMYTNRLGRNPHVPGRHYFFLQCFNHDICHARGLRCHHCAALHEAWN